MRYSFNNLRMRNKFILAFVFCALIPQIMLGFILFINLRHITLENAIQDARKNVQDAKNRITDIIENMIDISNKLYLDNKLLDILSTEYNDVSELYQDYTNYNEITYLLNIYKNIQSIKIYAYNKTLLNTGEIIVADEMTKKKKWFQEALKKDGKISWDLIYEDNFVRPQYYMSLVRLLKNTYGEKVGVIVIYAKGEEIKEFLSKNIETVVTLNNGMIIASSNDKLVGSRLNIGWSNNNEIMKDVTINGKKSTAIVGVLNVTGDEQSKLRVVSFFPQKEIYKRVNRVSMFAFFVIVFNLAVSLILMMVFSKLITDRISILNQKVNQISHGNLDVKIGILGNDEIGELTENVKIMAESIKNLINEVYVSNIQKQELLTRQKEIQLEVLCNQINPHFLFNTLESIRMKAICNNQTDIAQIVFLLSNLLRKSINMTHEIIPLRKEIEIVSEYLEIQKFRFGDKLDFIIDIDEKLLDYKILPFTIQPMVENSIKHGIEQMIGNGIIKISINEANDSIEIKIIDNGLGMSKQKLEDLKSTLDTSELSNVGLRNVYQRLKLYYGDEFNLNIQSRENVGTEIILTIPRR